MRDGGWFGGCASRTGTRNVQPVLQVGALGGSQGLWVQRRGRKAREETDGNNGDLSGAERERSGRKLGDVNLRRKIGVFGCGADGMNVYRL